MLGIYYTSGDRYNWWVESGWGLISHVTAVLAILVSFLSFGYLFVTWDIDWFQHFWGGLKKRKVYVDYETTGLGPSAEPRIHRKEE